MPGPAPQLDALRRERPDDKADWIILPALGREGDTPVWPLNWSGSPLEAREMVVWAQLWQTPQSVAWERNHSEWEVAFFVRRLVQAEGHSSSSQNATLVRQQMDSLGLTAPGMRSNRWKLSTDQLGERRLERPSLVPDRASSRNRVKKAA